MNVRHKSLFLRKALNLLMTLLSRGAVILATGMMIWIFGTIFSYGVGAISIDFLIHSSKPYGVPDGGIGNALLGTLMITFGAACLALPAALLAGVYLAEYREDRYLTNILRFLANVMMGMPSIITGLFVYVVFVTTMGYFSGFAGSVALALLMFPVVMRTTEDMLAMVPASLREAALALGMNRWRTTFYIVCRSARKGLMTGVLLSLSRVSGETAPLLFTALFADAWPTSYWDGPTANAPVLITEYTTNSPFAEMHQAGWGAALIITLLVLIFNLVARLCFKEKKNAH